MYTLLLRGESVDKVVTFLAIMHQRCTNRTGHAGVSDLMLRHPHLLIRPCTVVGHSWFQLATRRDLLAWRMGESRSTASQRRLIIWTGRLIDLPEHASTLKVDPKSSDLT